ncbi:hypothetical protein P3X46_023866 [Hevea brasiliensis]|uniref:DUF7722 domain-containing protein n=1 Tax=Hevea brasiliensis TaxID=3981 RepID=A0ABQ9LEA2_HEVBR|nr:hypothetical protein P3X46_023866 [Hevea brasiliensis]
MESCRMKVEERVKGRQGKKRCGYFQMPLLDHLLSDYGLPMVGAGVEQKRKFVIRAFLWPH